MYLFINALVFFVFLYFLVVFRDRKRRKGLPYPPGPPSRPIIGNLLDIPKNAPWTAYADMSKKYAIKDLFEKRAESYSDRPTLPILKMMDMDWFVPNTGMCDAWREERKLLDRSLRAGTTVSYRQMMEEKACWFLAQLIANPKEFRHHIELLQGKIIMSLTYGYDLNDGDEFMAGPIEATEMMSRVILPGAVLVNHLPFLRHIHSWVPFLNYGPLIQRARELSDRIRNEPFEFVKNAMRNGTAVQSLASEHLQDLEDSDSNGSKRQHQEEIIKMTLGSIYAAGADTAELDAVMGRDRLPTFDDRPRLPYIEALCKELMRWNMVTPTGTSLPHKSSRDDVYKGFFIPKGSIMVANAWAILHDPETYSDPEEFRPERFLNEDGSVRDDPALALAFGAGKRICPGRHIVDATLFIVASSVLSAFNVTKAKDEDGNEIAVKAEVTVLSGIVVHPKKFACSIVSRDEAAKDLILANTGS
ncbi:cytochrome P450 [Russula aff. rugulosa BPL654]|nr:cytochrome P450 [Russula aff. rugulosa BPL654]